MSATDPSDHPNADPEDAARELATAEIAVRQAYTAVESTDKPVKIEIEILQKNPTRALIESSRCAALLCVGSIGLKHSSQGRIGSTAAALATAAHCPLAVVHWFDSHRARQGWVVAELDEFSTLNGVLLCALDEARLRGLPVRALTTWQSRYTDIHANNAVAAGNRLTRARLDRRLSEWRKRYPDLDVEAVAVHGRSLIYFAKEAGSIKLLVIGHERAEGIRELVGPPGLCDAAPGGLFGVGLRTRERIVRFASGLSRLATERITW